jgi:hypothetical protein
VESKVHSALRPPMAYFASPWWIWWWKNRWNNWQGKPQYSENTCPSATLSTTNPTWCRDSNPGRRGGKPATNHLSYGTASLHYNSDSSTEYSSSTKLIFAQLIKKFPTFMKLKRSLPCSQEPATGLYPMPYESGSQTPILMFSGLFRK